jgi:hypothetical protein
MRHIEITHLASEAHHGVPIKPILVGSVMREDPAFKLAGVKHDHVNSCRVLHVQQDGGNSGDDTEDEDEDE